MAVTSIWPVHGTLKAVVDYTENPEKTKSPERTEGSEQGFFDVLAYVSNAEKTAQRQFVRGINCMPEAATEQMAMTKQRFGKTGGTVAFHGYQSFRFDEATPELAHQIGIETARKLWGDRFEVVVSTHLNTDSVHNHFVVNSVSFVDGNPGLVIAGPGKGLVIMAQTLTGSVFQKRFQRGYAFCGASGQVNLVCLDR